MAVYQFNTNQNLEPSEIGSKAHSLIQLARKGLPVPPGFALPVRFFQNWMDTIQSNPAWDLALKDSPENLEMHCQSLIKFGNQLKLDESQKGSLTEALSVLNSGGKTELFAVRSSSPQEDQAEAAFAGAYLSKLGVKASDLEQSIRDVFLSFLEYRVWIYKRRHEIDCGKPLMAVIVQQQVDADAAGVAYSLNPITNCFDEAVINANYGLGETVVSGAASPDQFVVDKIEKKILEKKIGSKEISIELGPNGDLLKTARPNNHQPSISDSQIMEIIAALTEVESISGRPVDIEWAFAENKLFLLQSRPITSYTPIPKALSTAAGERKQLYLDSTLIAQGVERPMSVMGTSLVRLLTIELMRSTMGSDKAIGIKDGLLDIIEGKIYINLSNALRLPGRKKTLDGYKAQDSQTVDTIEAIDISAYLPKRAPKKAIGMIFSLVFNAGYFVRFGIAILKFVKAPRKREALLQNRMNALVENLNADFNKDSHLSDWLEKAIHFYNESLFLTTPAYAAGALAGNRLKKWFKKATPKTQEQSIHIGLSIPSNITVKMGLAMFRLAGFSEVSQSSSSDDFISRLENRSFSLPFMEAWDDFMEQYGFRTPNELDIAVPRMYERPLSFYKQLKAISENVSEDANPQAIFNKGEEKRNKAIQSLKNDFPAKSKKIDKVYQTYLKFAGYREVPKYYIIYLLDLFRKKIQRIGIDLHKAGRLDAPDQVFDLTYEDLINDLDDKKADLRNLSERNTVYLKKTRFVKSFPRIFDSRGRIFRQPIKRISANQLQGEPISPGAVVGKVRILFKSDEKQAAPGEILVTHVTDPGWTPVFLNAAGIILEVGGVLQHGASAAREYGKPCIAGIENITTMLKDGDMIEMDGATGIVNILE